MKITVSERVSDSILSFTAYYFSTEEGLYLEVSDQLHHEFVMEVHKSSGEITVFVTGEESYYVHEDVTHLFDTEDLLVKVATQKENVPNAIIEYLQHIVSDLEESRKEESRSEVVV